jgi:tetratricopeptide (TPR) repeat protein
MTTIIRKTLLAAAVAMTIGTPTPVMAEEATRPEPLRAQELYRQAEDLLSHPKHWRRAVRLFEQSAQLRESSDPGIYACLVYAGRMRAGIGDYSGALAALERAGDSALGRGAVVDAAQAYIDAAHAAVELGRIREARELVDRATLLSESPLLSAAQKGAIMSRLEA